MVGEGILQGIEHVDSEIVTVVEVADRARVGPGTDEVGVEDVEVADADTVVVGGHCGVANIVEEGYIDGAEVVVGVTPVGSVDDAVLVQIHVYVIDEMRLGFGIGIDSSVVEAGFEILI